jgi:hypothetical protein
MAAPKTFFLTFFRIQLLQAAAGLFFDENLREPETAAGEFPGVLIADERHAFFADFREIDLPGFVAQGFRVELGAVGGLSRRVARRVGRGTVRFCGVRSGGGLDERVGFLDCGAASGLEIPALTLTLAFSLAATAFALVFLARGGRGLRFRPIVAVCGRGIAVRFRLSR